MLSPMLNIPWRLSIREYIKVLYVAIELVTRHSSGFKPI